MDSDRVQTLMGERQLKVAVIGGGWSGLAAAVELSHADIPVTVFEAAPNLGGRARGFQRNGHQLDNGQHILLGAYRQTLQLLRTIGVDESRVLQRLPLRLETPGHLVLSPPYLPAPLHLVAGLLSAGGLSWAERGKALKFMISLRMAGFKARSAEASVADLLADQPERLVKLLWEPLCLAALNTPIRAASAQVFLNVLHDSFGRARADSDLLLPRVDLSSLLPLAAAEYIRAKGGEIRMAAAIAAITPTLDHIEIDGETFSHVICAVSPHNLPRLLGPLPEMSPLLETVTRFEYQPIATIYLQYPHSVALPFPMLGMAAGFGQWVFDRGALCGQPGLLAVVVSAEGAHLQMPQEVLAAAVHEELQSVLGPLPQPEWQQVVIEKRATFACTPNLQRPGNVTPHPRIFVAGDYTASNYPATLEAAVSSGVQCATLLISSLAS